MKFKTLALVILMALFLTACIGEKQVVFKNTARFLVYRDIIKTSVLLGYTITYEDDLQEVIQIVFLKKINFPKVKVIEHTDQKGSKSKTTQVSGPTEEVHKAALEFIDQDKDVLVKVKWEGDEKYYKKILKRLQNKYTIE